MADEPVSVRTDGVIRRRSPWTDSVHRLLQHLAETGLRGVPVPSPETHADDDVVSFVPGAPLTARVFDDAQVRALGRLLRAVHDAGRSFRREPRDAWQPFEFRAAEPRRRIDAFLGDVVLGHGDTGPWNVLATPDGGVALIDWEFAGPIVRLDEIAATAWLDLRLHDPDVDDAAGRSSLPDKARLLTVFLGAYGVMGSSWPDVLRGMVDYAIRDTAYEATRTVVGPDGTPTSPDDLVWRLTWRARSAAWLVRHQEDLLAAMRDVAGARTVRERVLGEGGAG